MNNSEIEVIKLNQPIIYLDTKIETIYSTPNSRNQNIRFSSFYKDGDKLALNQHGKMYPEYSILSEIRKSSGEFKGIEKELFLNLYEQLIDSSELPYEDIANKTTKHLDKLRKFYDELSNATKEGEYYYEDLMFSDGVFLERFEDILIVTQYSSPGTVFCHVKMGSL